MERLINIDNGGTLTDICVWDGTDFTYTKTLTTPFDLSQCLFDGMAKASAEIFGQPSLPELLHSTKHIRYSTTQGTNALVERKGPRIGLITDDIAVLDELRGSATERALFDDLVGDRIAAIDVELSDEELTAELVRQVNKLTTDGAARLVVAAGDGADGAERRIRRILLRKFPRHLLGSVPILYSSEFTTDRVRSRRIWSSVLNSFLHPTMERFLYNAEDRLRSHRVKNPLLIYRNDGASSRVAKSVALKTYSSGPRGGLEGTRALAQAYGLGHVLMIDVGGTTTDVGSVRKEEILTNRRGSIEGAPISIPMSDVQSCGVGGSSIIAVKDGEITVGPESVGAAPGPACFGFGGTERHHHGRQPVARGPRSGHLPRRWVRARRRAVEDRDPYGCRGSARHQRRRGSGQDGIRVFRADRRVVRTGHRRSTGDDHRRVRRCRPDERLRSGATDRSAQRADPEDGRGVLRLRHRLLRHRAKLRVRPSRIDRRSRQAGARLDARAGRTGHVPGRLRARCLRGDMETGRRGRHRTDRVRIRRTASATLPTPRPGSRRH